MERTPRRRPQAPAASTIEAGQLGPGTVLTLAAGAITLGAVIAFVVFVLAPSLGQGRTALAPSPTATPRATVPAADVAAVHEALHDYSAICRTPRRDGVQRRVGRDVDTILAFAGRYPRGHFRIDDETGTTLSLLLATRQDLRDCAPAAAARVNRALPAEFQNRSGTS